MSTTTDQDYSIFNNYYPATVEVENKKKKASRACLHCQRAHLTCDDSRPCQRCIKRDLANTCTDAVRKRAKYLQDIPVDELFPNNNNATENNQQQTSTFSDSIVEPTSVGGAASTSQDMFDNNNPFNLSLSDMGFGSETIGLEYDFISTMLQNPLLDMTDNLNNAATSAPTTTATTAAPLHLSTVSMQQMINPDLNNNVFHVNSIPTTSSSNNFFTSNTSSPYLQHPVTPIPQTKPSPLADSPTIVTTKRTSNASTTSTSTVGRRKGFGSTPEEAYISVRKPFNYAEGFHYLIQYVREKMGRDDLMRISRSLALFRPSFLALIMNLTEEDLVFMEKCIQRTLLEYEKLISFSGTPTVVWRRTGEICLVGKEFSLLTQWTKDMLLGKKMYIYELMDRKSAVEYWEKFSTHAFDNTDKSCIYSCTITTPQQKHVPCTFCFTIKRDIFDLPSVIIGNFLPILS